MRLILLGSLLHWKNQLPVGGVPVYSQMSRSKSQQFSQLSLVLGLQENRENVCIGCPDKGVGPKMSHAWGHVIWTGEGLLSHCMSPEK